MLRVVKIIDVNKHDILSGQHVLAGEDYKHV